MREREREREEARSGSGPRGRGWVLGPVRGWGAGQGRDLCRGLCRNLSVDCGPRPASRSVQGLSRGLDAGRGGDRRPRTPASGGGWAGPARGALPGAGGVAGTPGPGAWAVRSKSGARTL
jgi:hypothetical protein